MRTTRPRKSIMAHPPSVGLVRLRNGLSKRHLLALPPRHPRARPNIVSPEPNDPHQCRPFRERDLERSSPWQRQIPGGVWNLQRPTNPGTHKPPKVPSCVVKLQPSTNSNANCGMHQKSCKWRSRRLSSTMAIERPGLCLPIDHNTRNNQYSNPNFTKRPSPRERPIHDPSRKQRTVPCISRRRSNSNTMIKNTQRHKKWHSSKDWHSM